jgi:hypothetical protein
VKTLAKNLAWGDAPTDEVAWKVLLGNAFSKARRGIKAYAAAQNIPVTEFATTLLVVVAGAGFATAAQVGDGAIVASSQAGEVFTLIPPEPSEYANVTTFLTSLDSVEQTRFAHWCGPLGHLALLSDGLQFLALRMPEGEAHPPFFEPMFRFCGESEDPLVASTQLAAFLGSPRVRDKADDDLTLLMASIITTSEKS